MKVLLISHSQKTGGAEKCLLEAAIGLQAKGFEVLVLMPCDGPLSDALKGNNIAFHITPYPWWVHFKRRIPGLLLRIKRMLSNIWYTARLFKILKKLDPDVVLSNTLCVSAAAVASKALNIKHVWFIHEYGKEDHGLVFDLGFYLSSKIISYTAKDILVNSAAIRDKFAKHIPVEKFSVVFYDIPLPEASNTRKGFIRSGRYVHLLLVGQISSNKGQMDAVQALEILLHRGYQGKLCLVGQIAEESYFNSIQTFIQERGLKSNIEFVGHTNFPFKVAPDSCIGLMCSEWEALGRVTIEYMKLGIPVIGADSGTTSSLITHDLNGLVYELRNPTSLADQVEYLLSDQQKANSIVKNAKAFAMATFNSENFMKGLVSKLV